MTIPFMWCYAYPNAMEGHQYTDDVALCFALTRNRAMKKFKRFYVADLTDSRTEIFRVSLNSEGIAILTDY